MIKKIYKSIVSERRRIKIRLQLNKAASVFYRGGNFQCNVCGKSFRKFKPKGTVAIRENAVCPYCGSLERSRLLLFYLQNETKIFSAQKVSLLHFAPEWELAPILKKAENLHYVSGDINPDYADEQIDITDIHYPDESFDYIICSHVLGHVPDEEKAVRELFRVLKNDGTTLILSLIDRKNQHTYELPETLTAAERLAHYSEPDLCRLHGGDFSNRLEKGGFTVETIDYRTVLGEEKQRIFSLGNGDRETIFRCTKNFHK